MFRGILFAMMAMVTLIAAGCSGSLGTVHGVVTMDGEPVEGVSLEFVPVEGGRPSQALTNADGEYHAIYTRSTNGAEFGEHTVRFQKFDSSGDVSEEDEFSPPTRKQGGDSDDLKGRKLQPSTVTVKPGSNEINFELVK